MARERFEEFKRKALANPAVRRAYVEARVRTMREGRDDIDLEFQALDEQTGREAEEAEDQ